MPSRIALSAPLLVLLIANPILALSTEITGTTASGTNFRIEANSVASPSNQNGNWGFIELSYKTENQESTANYKLPIQAPALVKKNPIGIISISEKIGGMNGTYKITYLYTTDISLEFISGVDGTLENGKFTSAESFSPKWTNEIKPNEKSNLIKSIAINRDHLIGKTDDLTIDNALLLLTSPELPDEIRKHDPSFFKKYSDNINKNVDSSVANLVRKKILTPEISLCDPDQFDVFACKLDRKSISLCLGKKDGSSVIQYRAGSKEKIELLLENPTPGNLSDTTESLILENRGYSYTVRFGQEKGTSWSGVVIRKGNHPIAKQQCQPGTIEPYLLPKR